LIKIEANTPRSDCRRVNFVAVTLSSANHANRNLGIYM